VDRPSGLRSQRAISDRFWSAKKVKRQTFGLLPQMGSFTFLLRHDYMWHEYAWELFVEKVLNKFNS